MDREEKLLKQYEVCQHDSSSMVSAHWTVVGIFIGINAALLGAVAYMLSSSFGSTVQWTVLALGLASGGIFVCLWAWLNRVNKRVRCNECLMRDIEGELNIEVKKKLRGDGSCPIRGIYGILILLWIAAIVGVFYFPC